MIIFIKNYMYGSPCFHLCLGSTIWEDTLLLQSEETLHHCPELCIKVKEKFEA